MDFLLNIVETINSYLTDYVLLILLIGIGLFYTIRTRFVQVRFFGKGVKDIAGGFNLNGEKQKGGLSSFQALATAIAAQVGTGNIVGACAAILVGGPGAIFWMWIIAFLGMATIYAEATLAQKTRVVHEDGSVSGGPVYYIRTAFKGKFGKFLAGFFSVAAIIALGFVGATVQSDSIANTSSTAFGIAPWIVGLIVAAICAIVFIGGAQRIASVAEKVVPFMAILYIVGSLVVIATRIQFIPETFGMIFKYAFTPQAITGGLIGEAIMVALSQGAKRGLFSNEAGMGSTPHAHALAKVKDPHDQGVSAMMGVFIDTFIVLTMTALVVISTLYAGGGVLGTLIGNPLIGTLDAEGNMITLKTLANGMGVTNTNMAQMAFGSVFTQFFGAEVGVPMGNIFVAICLFFFAFTTILSWNLFGKINMTYLFGKKSEIVYAILAVGFVFLGSVFKNDLVWALTDMANYLMVLPNAIALLALSGIVVGVVKNQKKKKQDNLEL